MAFNILNLPKTLNHLIFCSKNETNSKNPRNEFYWVDINFTDVDPMVRFSESPHLPAKKETLAISNSSESPS